MTVHKSVVRRPFWMFTCVKCERTCVELCICPLQIYSGCNDGSIQAVKINLMKNFHCWVRTDSEFRWVLFAWVFFPPDVFDLFSASRSPGSVAELLSGLRHSGAPRAASPLGSHQPKPADGQMSLEKLQHLFCRTAVSEAGRGRRSLDINQWSTVCCQMFE